VFVSGKNTPAWLAHDTARPGQIEMIEQATAALLDDGIHLAAAPTGIGKTAAALAAALSASRTSDSDVTIMFMTGKQSQHRIVVDTIGMINKRLNKGEMPIKVVDMIGRASMCENLDAFTGTCECEGAGGGFSNPRNESAKDEVSAFILSQPRHVEETIIMSRNHKVCPWKAARASVSSAEVVICDYNHLFIDDVRNASLPSMGLAVENLILIVDEAHNLPDRVRMGLERGLTPTIVRNSVFEVEEMIGEMKKDGTSSDQEIASKVWTLQVLKDMRQRLGRLFDDLITRMGDKSELALESSEITAILDISFDAVAATMTQATLAGDLPSGKPQKEKRNETFISNLANNQVKSLDDDDPGEQDTHRLAHMLAVLMRFTDGTALSIVFDGGGRDGRIRLRLLDPGLVSGPVFARCRGSILMSGTLNPPSMYADLLGISGPRCSMAVYESPFAKERRPVVVADDVTTLYKARSPENTKKIQDHIQQLLDNSTGHIAVFAPSYHMIEEMIASTWFTGARTVIESRDWTKRDVDELVIRLRELKGTKQRRLIVGVFGGRLSEGVDYHGGLLDAVACIGIPNPPPSAYQNSLKTYMETRFGRENAWRYAATQPAINSILQGMGRPIRAMGDRALILLLDRRIKDQTYSRCFPSDIRFNNSSNPQSTGRIARRFFAKVLPLPDI
jgi:DNA excision repair protein ERCC-2